MVHAFGYHSYTRQEITTPSRTYGNIKGLELEISDSSAKMYRILDDLIDKNLITDYENMDYGGNEDTPYTICVENDTSVCKELIFKASCNRTLLQGVKMLSENFHGEINNHHGTSAHIHINNRYLNEIGLNKLDIIKSTEFILPILYRISGRGDADESRNGRDWCESVVGMEDEMNLFLRTKYIDNIRTNECRNRYNAVNITPTNTTEIRVFSNYHNFNYKYIKLYLETVDFIMDLAVAMKNKKYKDYYEYALELTNNHFSKRRYKEIFERDGLIDFFVSPEEHRRRYYIRMLEKLNRKIQRFYERPYINNFQKQMSFIRVIRDNIEDDCVIRFNIMNPNYEEVFEVLRDNIRNQIEE